MMKRVETQNLGLLMAVTMGQRGRHYTQLPDLVQPRQEILGKHHKRIKI
jgi:hypothetical protein